MFSVGDCIIYHKSGVCRVEAIGKPPVPSEVGRAYYTLTPLYGSGTIYVPVDTSVFMRPILTRTAAEKLIDRLPGIQQAQLEGQDSRTLAQEYRGFLESHCCEDLVQLIKAVYTRERQRCQSGKKLSSVDQEFQRRAEMLLHGELAVALGLSLEQVPEYIRQKLDKKEERR